MLYILGLFFLLMLACLGFFLWLLVGGRVLSAWIFISLGTVPLTLSGVYVYMRESGYQWMIEGPPPFDGFGSLGAGLGFTVGSFLVTAFFWTVAAFLMYDSDR